MIFYKPYLDVLKIDKYRMAMPKLRMSSHRLEIEADRWHTPKKIPLSNRKRNLCNDLEDAFHFISVCVLYNDLRKKYIKKYLWKRPNILKFVELLTSSNRTINKNLPIFHFRKF